MKIFSAYYCRMALACSALLTIAASVALAGQPSPPFCLSFDGTPPEPGASCCESTPAPYDDENGPLGNGTAIGELSTRSDTFHSIGFVWDIDGDADHDGSVSVRYRKAGACNFEPAMPLIRNDYAWFYQDEGAAEPANNFAGSLMFLSPGTNYEVVLELSDPDGGQAIRAFETTTRAIPVKPTAGTTYYAVAGSGSGNAGTSDDPFEGLAEANASVSPGDIVKLRDTNGAFSKDTLSTSGAEDNHIVYESDTGHSPVIDAIALTADHIWIDNLTFTYTGGFSAPTIFDDDWQETSAIYVPPPSSTNPDDIIVTNSTFTGYENAIVSYYEISRWVAMDNTIVGPWAVDVWLDPIPHASAGKGIALGGEGNPGGPGCVAAFNSITRVSDGITIAANSDVYANQVWDVAGNAVSADGSFENVRIWGNRFMQSASSPFTTQPQKLGPWYYLYNQMGDALNGIFKFRTQDRLVLINNTFLGASELRGQLFLRFVMRNNLFIDEYDTIWNTSDSANPDPEQLTSDWRTDIDYNGFDAGGMPLSGSNRFFWWDNNTTSYYSVAAFSAGVTGSRGVVEPNGVEVDADLIFTSYDPDSLVPNQSYELAAGTNAAVDAGQIVDNLSDFHGSTPDLGAHQRAATPLPYGPRGSGTPLDQQENYWAKH